MKVLSFFTGLFPAVLSLAALAAADARMAPPSSPPSPLFGLYFEAFTGTDGTGGFVAQGRRHRIVIQAAGADLMLFRGPASPARPALSRQWISTVKPATAGTIHLDFPGSAPNPVIAGADPAAGKVNYLIGPDSAGWRTGLPLYRRVAVTGLYPGIDLVYYGNEQQLEYDFTVGPGADPGSIRMRFAGVDTVSISQDGELVLRLNGAEMRQHRPVLYQIIDGKRQRIAGGFDVLDARTVAFWVGKYNKTLPLVIDPILSYSSYFGGPGGDIALSVKVDAQGSVYMAGQTLSKGITFADSTNSLQKQFAGGSINGDGFIAKFDSTGSNLVYFTYLGGKANDGILDLAVDLAGNAYVVGFTASPNFPVRNALAPHIHGSVNTVVNAYYNDAFVSELNSEGSDLVFSTYVGGSRDDVATGVAVDRFGSACVTGFTKSQNFPVYKPLPGKGKHSGSADAFVTRYGPGGTNYIYSLLMGGGASDVGEGVAMDSEGFTYVTGYTYSKGFPLANAFQTKLNSNSSTGISDGFLALLEPTGGLVFSTYLGGTGTDAAFRVAVDRDRNALVTGYTYSTKNFPLTVTNIPAINAVTNSNKHCQAFLTKVGTDLQITGSTNDFGQVTLTTNIMAAVRYSAVWGGKGDDAGWDVGTDLIGNAYVVGITLSANFPHFNTSGFLTSTNSGKRDGFISAFTPNAGALLYSGYLGGAKDDYAYGIAVSPAGDAWVVGRTVSADFPVAGALQSSRVGSNDAFLSLLQHDEPPAGPVSSASGAGPEGQ